MAHQTPSLQAGIFTNDLCISFRIILQEVLENFVFKILADAKSLSKGNSDETRIMYERGVRSVNSWDTNLKERYRAQVVAQYRQIAQLYRHIFLMYVEEMYHESLGDITVRVSIPSLSNMLFTFIKLACNNPAVYSGEYVASMPFMGRVLFTETTVRRTLYELLVQQNNIKGITTAKASSPEVSSPMSSPLTKTSRPQSRVAIVEESSVQSHDLAMGQPNDTKQMDMQALTQRLSRISGGSGSTNSVSSVTSARSPNIAMPSMHSSSLDQPAFSSASKPSFKFFDNEPTEASVSAAAPNVVGVPSPAASPMPSPPILPAPAPTLPLPTVTSPAPPATGVTLSTTSSAAKAAALPVLSAIGTPVQSLTGNSPGPEVPATQPSVAISNPTMPTSVQAAAETATTEPLFSIASQFTAHKPAGHNLPPPNMPRIAMQNDGQLDSLQLLPSDQDFGGEVRRLLDSNTTNSITPFDSVTNIGSAMRPPQPAVRKSLYLPQRQ